jgi:hypothetical protein
MAACLCDVVLVAELAVCEGEDDLVLLLLLMVQVPDPVRDSLISPTYLA